MCVCTVIYLVICNLCVNITGTFANTFWVLTVFAFCNFLHLLCEDM